MSFILILGALPPPIGGIGVHLVRTIKYLDRSNLDYKFIDYTRTPLASILKSIMQSSIIHTHFSSSYIRFIMALFCKIFQKTYIFTFHGNLGRYSKIRNIIDRASTKLADFPIFLNVESHAIGKFLNRNARLITAFVPPDDPEPLPADIAAKIDNLIKVSRVVYCTSAHDYVPKKGGDDLYGIKTLCDIFIRDKMSSFGLIVSDPSGNNLKAINKKYPELPNNILFISRPHSLVEVIKKSDVYIRATSTDGDALSVREALYYNVAVIASDCVSRPPGCILYRNGDNQALTNTLFYYETHKKRVRLNATLENGALKLIQLYRGFVK